MYLDELCPYSFVIPGSVRKHAGPEIHWASESEVRWIPGALRVAPE
jgi:hypothetical protein